MHICFITHEFPKPGFPHGGIGTFVATLGKALVEKGINVSVVGLNYESKEETEVINGIRVHRLSPKKVKGLQWYFNSKAISSRIKKIHQSTPIDFVETPELGLTFLSKCKDIKYVIRMHGGHHFFAEAENRSVNFWKAFQEKRSFKKADAFIAVSQYVKDHTEKFLSYHDKPIEVIFNPINTDLFKTQENLIEPYSITFVGSICEKKGIRQLIQAFGLVKEQYPEAVLNVYGRDWFFKDGRSYLKMLHEKELPQLGEFANAVFFKGVVPLNKIPEVYAKASVCVFPSHMETLGLVALEAMAMGKIVIFTNKGPGKEVVEDEVTGLLCDPLDPMSIAAKIKWVFNSSEESIKIGINAQLDVFNRFGLNGITEKNIVFYERNK